MAANDVKLLADMLAHARVETESVLDENEHQVYFTAKHYLRDMQPTHDDLLAGIVDGTKDGGIDACYLFANGYCIRDDTPLQGLGRNPSIDLVLLQVKNSSGFGESAIEKMVINLPILLDFDRDESKLAQIFNARLIEISRRFLDTYRTLELPTLQVFVCFASLKAEHLHPSTLERSTLLGEVLKECFGSCSVETHFLDAAGIADLARQLPVMTRSLTLAESPISTDVRGGYIGVVRLAEYERFITDAAGKLDPTLFEANVRDYEGDNDVNRSIRATLGVVDEAVDFWWLNNGVTIVADRVQQANKILELRSPQVVNGLQTSHEIYKRGRVEGAPTDQRTVLVKIIEAQNVETRDRIIRATNSQTSLGPSSLRATDKVQRQVEEHLKTEGLYYERRRHLYGNQGIPLSKLVSIDQMGQALLATLAQSPHVARGRLSDVFSDEIYGLLFNPGYAIQMYSSAIRIVRECEGFLRSSRETSGQIDDFCFHLSMLTAIALTRKAAPSDKDLAAVTRAASPEIHAEMLQIVREEFAQGAQRRKEVLMDRVAKDPEVTARLLDRGRQYLRSSSRS